MTLYDASYHKQVWDWLKPNPALRNSFMKMHLNMSARVLRNGGDFVQGGGGETSLFRGPHTFAHDWIAQDSVVCRTWTSMEQSRHYRTDNITLINPETHRSSYAIAMVAHALASNRRRAIINHRTDVIMVIKRVKGFKLQPLNNVRERSRGRPPVSFFVIDGLALWPR